MAYRFTNTEKWSDSWFCELTKNQKLLFLYLCDNCDIAGFIEVNKKRWQADLDFNSSEILGAIEGLARGLIYSESGDCIFIRNFLKHQKNMPLNEKNNAHNGIIKRFDIYREKFKITEIELFINQDVKPLTRGYGKGKGKGKGISKEDLLNFREKKFIEEMSVFKEKYTSDVLNSFYRYWTEKTPKGDKMKFELQKTFEISKRLITWNNNQSKFSNNGTTKPKFNNTANRIDEPAYLAGLAKRLFPNGNPDQFSD